MARALFSRCVNDVLTRRTRLLLSSIHSASITKLAVSRNDVEKHSLTCGDGNDVYGYDNDVYGVVVIECGHVLWLKIVITGGYKMI